MFLGIFSFLLIGVFSYKNSFASPNSGNVTGFAWSSNVGWTSFNCSNLNTCGTVNYGVTVSPAGDFSGYAWNSNLGTGGSSAGWLSFNPGDTAPCGPNAHLDLASGNISGWAKFLVNTSNSGGWDGCLHLASNSGSLYGLNYHSSEATNNVHGFAWGSTNVGWTSFNGANYGVTITLPPADLYLQSGASVVYSGNNWQTTLTWGSQSGSGFSSCTASTSPVMSGTNWQGTTISPNNCPTLGNTGPFSRLVTVPPGNNPIQFCLDAVPVSGGSVQANPHCVSLIRGYNPTITLGGVANIVSGTNNWVTNLTWSSADLVPNSCVKTSSPALTSWSGAGSCAGSASQIPAPQNPTVYTITGTGLDGLTYVANLNIGYCSNPPCSANVTIHPKFKEK